jgi:arginine/lysine/ornithine decarboxylase
MSKTETLRQSAAASNETQLERLASQIETVRQSKLQSVEELTELLEPLAQAMATLTDETRETLALINKKSREQGEAFSSQTNQAAENLKQAVARAQQAANRIDQAGARAKLVHYALAALTGLLTAAFVTVFWLWVAPPAVQNQLNSKEVAEHLKPALIEALKAAKGR